MSEKLDKLELIAVSAMRNLNQGHGHVFKRPDGNRARCGGPRMCKECARDNAELQARVSPNALAAKDAEIERLRAGIRKVIEEGAPRKVAQPYATDGSPHRGDRCPHGMFTWDSCDSCTDEYLVALLADTPTQATTDTQHPRSEVPQPRTPGDHSGGPEKRG